MVRTAPISHCDEGSQISIVAFIEEVTSQNRWVLLMSSKYLTILTVHTLNLSMALYGISKSGIMC